MCQQVVSWIQLGGELNIINGGVVNIARRVDGDVTYFSQGLSVGRGYASGTETGVVNISGQGSTLNDTGLHSYTSIGVNGQGVLNVTDGAQANLRYLNAGRYQHNELLNGRGNITVDGVGSGIESSYVQLNHTSTLDVRNGANVNITYRLENIQNSTVNIDGSGSSLSTGQIRNQNDVTISNGALVVDGSLLNTWHNESVSTIYTEDFRANPATLTIKDVGSLLSVTHGDLQVGVDYNPDYRGVLSVDTGANLEVADALVIAESGQFNLVNGNASLGAMSVSGDVTIDAGTVLVNSVEPDALSINDGANVNQNGGAVTSTNMLLTGGDYNLNGGSLSAGVVDLNGGSLSLNTGLSALAVADFHFNAGSLSINDNLRMADGELLGASTDVSLAHNLEVTGVTTIDTGSNIAINGGSFSTGSLVNNGGFSFNSGAFNLTNSNLIVGAGGLLGENLTLAADRALGVSGVTIIESGRSLNINGGNFSTGSINNQGGFAFNSGTFNLTNSGLLVDDGELLGANIDLASNRSLGVSGTTTIAADKSLSINGGSFSSGQIVNNGALSFNSGALNLTSSNLTVGAGGLLGEDLALGSDRSLSVSGTTTIDVDNVLTINGGGFSTGGLDGCCGELSFISGDLALTNSDLTLGQGGNSVLGAEMGLDANKSLSVSGVLNLTDTGSLTMSGGTLAADSLVLAGGELSIGTDISGLNTELVFNSGSLNVDGDFLVDDEGLLGYQVTLVEGQSLLVSGATNIADVDGYLTIDGGTFSTGSYTGLGEFAFNRGTLNLTASDLDIACGGPFGCDLQLTAGKAVNVSGDVTVNVTNGIVLDGGSLTAKNINNAGEISGAGTIGTTEGGLTNTGRINLDGNSQVDGVVNNTIDGTINIAANSTTTFTGNVDHEGTGYSAFRIDDGAQAVFEGMVTGSGDFSGMGTAVFAGGFGPGSSPGLVAFEGDVEFTDTNIFSVEMAGYLFGTEYDGVEVGGDAYLDGTLNISLLDEFAPELGDTFDILFAQSIIGEFSEIDFIALGFGWDVSYILDENELDIVRLTAVEVSAVPLPGAVWLFGSGLIGLIGISRRRKRA